MMKDVFAEINSGHLWMAFFVHVINGAYIRVRRSPRILV